METLKPDGDEQAFNLSHREQRVIELVDLVAQGRIKNSPEVVAHGLHAINKRKFMEATVLRLEHGGSSDTFDTVYDLSVIDEHGSELEGIAINVTQKTVTRFVEDHPVKTVSLESGELDGEINFFLERFEITR